jgi:hypothetical protein
VPATVEEREEKMQLRKLESSEHGLTRKLWEKVFHEDSREFLDYYYFIKTRDNLIYTIEEDDAFRSMLQLNPYMLQIQNKQFLCHYIIAVATEESYRKRGYMGKLLREAMKMMYTAKEPFTFLMPAAEAIYTPYDFRFIYHQNQTMIDGREFPAEIEVKDADLGDALDMAGFFETNISGSYQVYAVRDEKYYQTMIVEQRSEHGGVMLMKQDGELVGMFAYAGDSQIEVREPLYLPEYEWAFQKAVYELRAGRKDSIKVFAGPEDKQTRRVPLIMARILHLRSLLEVMEIKEGETLNCSFAVLDTIITQNSRIWRLRSDENSQHIQISETEDSEGVLTIGALTSLLFGDKSPEEVCEEEEEVIMSPHLKGEFQKLKLLNQIYLNEVV